MLPAVIRAIYPPQCMGCGTPAAQDHALCGSCWSETPFIGGLVCDACGTPLPGEGEGAEGLLCDDCLKIARPWSRGRAALVYRDHARRFVLQLKHGDRTELSGPLGRWMAKAARPLAGEGTLVVPVPLHPFRLFRRRYNQAALLARSVAEALGRPVCLDALVRTRRTPSLGGLGREARFQTLQDAFAVRPKHLPRIEGAHILLVDDVMTTGATLAAGTEALTRAGAAEVDVLTLARAARDT